MASLKKRGAVYYIRFKRGDRWVDKSLGTTSAREARALLEQYVDAEPAGALSWDALIDHYLQWAEGHRAAQTIESRVRALRRMAATSGARTPSCTTLAHIEAYKGAYRLTVSNRSVNESLTALKSVFNRAIKQGILRGPNPFAGAERLPEHKKAVKWLTDAECVRGLTAAADLGTDQLFFWALGIFAGFRKGEAVAARWDWFDFEARIVQVQSGPGFEVKDREDRAVPLSADLEAVIRAYAQPSGYLIAPHKLPGKYRYRFDVRKGFAAVCKAAELDIHPHTLRHTFASRLAQSGVDLFKIGRWMGHSHTSVTELYGHLKPYDADIDRATLPKLAPPDDPKVLEFRPPRR